jgi:hypothetical protein
LNMPAVARRTVTASGCSGGNDSMSASTCRHVLSLSGSIAFTVKAYGACALPPTPPDSGGPQDPRPNRVLLHRRGLLQKPARRSAALITSGPKRSPLLRWRRTFVAVKVAAGYWRNRWGCGYTCPFACTSACKELLVRRSAICVNDSSGHTSRCGTRYLRLVLAYNPALH